MQSHKCAHAVRWYLYNITVNVYQVGSDRSMYQAGSDMDTCVECFEITSCIMKTDYVDI